MTESQRKCLSTLKPGDEVEIVYIGAKYLLTVVAFDPTNKTSSEEIGWLVLGSNDVRTYNSGLVYGLQGTNGTTISMVKANPENLTKFKWFRTWSIVISITRIIRKSP